MEPFSPISISFSYAWERAKDDFRQYRCRQNRKNRTQRKTQRRK